MNHLHLIIYYYYFFLNSEFFQCLSDQIHKLYYELNIHTRAHTCSLTVLFKILINNFIIMEFKKKRNRINSVISLPIQEWNVRNSLINALTLFHSVQIIYFFSTLFLFSTSESIPIVSINLFPNIDLKC